MTDEYAAGFFDGEGSVGLYSSRRSISPRISITQRRPAVLREFVRRWGGRLRPSRDFNEWNCPITSIPAFLDAVIPHLKEKRDQARLLREALKYPGTSWQRAEFALMIKALKA